MKVSNILTVALIVTAVVMPAAAQQGAGSAGPTKTGTRLSTHCGEEVRRWCPQTSEPDRHACIGADKSQLSPQCKLEVENRGY